MDRSNDHTIFQTENEIRKDKPSPALDETFYKEFHTLKQEEKYDYFTNPFLNSQELKQETTNETLHTRKQARVEQKFDYFLVLDFEATCLEKQVIRPQEIIEFPVIAINSKTLQAETEFRRFVKPFFHPQLSKFCTSLTGITQDQVENAKPFKYVLNEFDSWLGQNGFLNGEKTFTFVTCGNWDLQFMLPHQCRLLKIPVQQYFKDWIDLKTAF
ncbi:UNVERIFIED_CONTAM: hypothetical protein GTU68_038341, partial [Idotea baltica]|nr:hypothetical protein [Idotea baltica]